MKTLTITEWMKTSPKKEDITRVENLIMKIQSSSSKRDIYDLQKKFNKLSRVEKGLKDIEIPVPGEISDGLRELKTKIEELKKSLPEVKKRVKKEVKK
jgi:hypothetical protein